MTYKNEWFSGCQSVQDLPADCVADCSASGAADDAVSFWVKWLGFEGPSWAIRRHLRAYGAWDRSELCDHRQNLHRLLWVWACDCRESGEPVTLYLED